MQIKISDIIRNAMKSFDFVVDSFSLRIFAVFYQPHSKQGGHF
jgi:hypothetical protein